MRIALAQHGWPPEAMGGTGLYVAALASALQELGHEVSLLAPTTGPRPALVATSANGLRAHLLQAPPPRRWEHTWRQPERAALIQPWLDEARPEILHVHHLSGLPWGLLAAARAWGVRTVLTLHDYALPCGRGQLVDRELKLCVGPAPERCAACLSEQLALSPALAAAGDLLRRWPRLRAVARRGVARARRLGPPGQALSPDQERVSDRLAAASEALAAADVLLSPSLDLADRFQALGFPRPLPCALPLLQPVPPAPPPGEGPVRFLFASALIPTKGPDRLLDAFAALPPGLATLTFAGPAPPFDGAPGFAARLRARAESTPGVGWAGEVPNEAVPALLAGHDVLVLPSIWPENSPLVVREATAAGLRVVVGEAGGGRELAPEARVVPSRREDGGALLAALTAEAEAGRGRVVARSWPSPREHAAWLVGEVYQG